MTAADLEETLRDLEKSIATVTDYYANEGELPDRDDEWEQAGVWKPLERAATYAQELYDEAKENQPDLAADYARIERVVATAQRLLAGEPPAESRADNQAAALSAIAKRATLHRTPEGELFATFDVRGHRQTWPIASAQFKRWLVLQYATDHNKPPQPASVNSAIQLLEARAEFYANEQPVYTRVGERDGNVYIDIGDPWWQVFEVTRDDWHHVEASPVRFRRPPGQRTLPTDLERPGSLEPLRDLINVSDADWPLVAAWIVAGAFPTGPYPVLVLHGIRGRAKTTTTRLLRSVLDPHHASTRDAPREARDLAIAARQGHVIAFDNLSGLKDWLSDACCRLATGAGFATRRLYENDQEIVFFDQRPIVMNGIEALAVRGDLLDRSLVIETQPIAPHKRLTEQEINEAFAAVHPKVLAGVLEAVACALRNLPDTNLDRLPRMADFARRIEAAAPALGWEPGFFLDLYDRNASAAIDIELEASPIAHALLRVLETVETEWKGPAKELLIDLGQYAQMSAQSLPSWPKTAKALHGALKRLAPALEARGVAIDLTYREPGRGRERRIVITKTDAWNVSEDASDVSTTCPTGAAFQSRNGSTADTSDTSDTSSAHSRLRPSREKEEGEGQQPALATDVSNVSEASEPRANGGAT